MGFMRAFRNVREKIYGRLRFRMGIDRIIYEQHLIEDIYIPASVAHQKVFPKYKNILQGKKIVLIAGGPTVDYFKPFEGEEYLYAGINNAYKSDKWKLSYLFAGPQWSEDKEENENESKLVDLYEGNNCINFFAYRNREQISMKHRNQKNVENYFVAGNDYGLVPGNKLKKEHLYTFPVDLSVSPVKGYGTTAISACQILLWMHPDEIYLVGCDCSVGHCTSTGYQEEEEDFTYLIDGWKLIKEFADDLYPDVKIVSVNPVGLKGVFNDMYTEEYRKTSGH